MKSFLLDKNNKPIIPWGNLEDGIFYEGNIPENYSLAISPGNSNIIIVDVDKKGDKNGFLHLPIDIFGELDKTFNYYTKSGGKHYFLSYTGDKTLLNKSTSVGIDLRIGSKPGNSGGYVRYNGVHDIRQCIHLIKPTSNELNLFLENLFCNGGK